MHGRTTDILRQSLAVPLVSVSKTSGSWWNQLPCLREACGSFTTQEKEFLSVAYRCVFERVDLCSWTKRRPQVVWRCVCC